MLIYRILKNYRLARRICQAHAYPRDKYEDRNVLESMIIPYVLSHWDPEAVLDVGREEYQSFYNEFFSGRELWTIDIDPARARFGADNHIVGDAARIASYFPAKKFDFVLLNGVFNWGLNKKEDMEKCLAGLHRIMKKGAFLVIGWNDFKDVKIIDPAKLDNIRLFKPFRFPPLKTDRFKCQNGEHTYNFYVKQ